MARAGMNESWCKKNKLTEGNQRTVNGGYGWTRTTDLSIMSAAL